MYSPVFLSCPTTSGSPPVLSISLSDHSFSALASSLACILAHSRPLWRFIFFSKRTFNALSSSSRCTGDNSFLLLLMWVILLLQAHRPRVPCVHSTSLCRLPLQLVIDNREAINRSRLAAKHKRAKRDGQCATGLNLGHLARSEIAFGADPDAS